MSSGQSRTVVVADGYNESRQEIGQIWKGLLLDLGQKPQILEASGLNCMLNMALHGGVGGSQADLVSIVGSNFVNAENARGWLLPRNGGCASAHSLQDYLRCNEFRGFIVAIVHDVALLSPDNFDGIWPRDVFCMSPQKLKPLARKLFGLKK